MNALDLALRHNAETGVPVFPCLGSKKPACPHGFLDATSDPTAIRKLWKASPGPLVGMPTGEASGLSALDLDAVKHPKAGAWFNENRDQLLPTLTIETRSGGWHCFYQHRDRLRNAVKLFGIPGVDIRATGGYVILWALHGCRTLMQGVPAPWPAWVTPPRPERPDTATAPRVPDDASIGHLVRWVARAGEGERNSRTFWAGKRLAEQVSSGLMQATYAAALIEQAGVAAGLPVIEARKTARSAIYGVQS